MRLCLNCSHPLKRTNGKLKHLVQVSHKCQYPKDEGCGCERPEHLKGEKLATENRKAILAREEGERIGFEKGLQSRNNIEYLKGQADERKRILIIINRFFDDEVFKHCDMGGDLLISWDELQKLLIKELEGSK